MIAAVSEKAKVVSVKAKEAASKVRFVLSSL